MSHMSFPPPPAAETTSTPASGSNVLNAPGGKIASSSASMASSSIDPKPGSEQPRKVDVSHYPHYGLKRGMACTFCRRRKLRCSGDRPTCTNCVKYAKACEYGPPVKDPKQPKASSSGYPSVNIPAAPMPSAQPPVLPTSLMYSGQPPPSASSGEYDYYRTDGVYVDSNLLSASFAGQMFPPSPFGSEFHHQSPFVSHPGPIGSQSVSPAPIQPMPMPLHQMNLQEMAQPPIGMPPYVPPTGPEFSFVGTSTQAWYAPPTNGYDASTLPHDAIMTEAYTAEPLYDPTVGMATILSSANGSRMASDPSTPEEPPSRRSGTNSMDTPTSDRPQASRMYRHTPSLQYPKEVSVVDGLTERLGEFLFSPNAASTTDEEAVKRRKGPSGGVAMPKSPESLTRMRTEYDGLSDSSRSLLLDCFLAHHSLFFEMSVPRFRYRMTFVDRRRPSLALLNAMYLWATRISNSPETSNMERHFFEQACKHLDVSMSTVDRLIDAVRAAMLLSAYSHSSGRHHEGWCLAGLAIRLVLSCGLHRIKSCVHKSEVHQNPFLRNRFFLLPPPEDAVELGERIHAFWAVFAIDRCASLATGYPAGLRDEEITTPFGRHLADIASGSVSERDDVTVRDLYLGRASDGSKDTPYTKWVKCVAILERATKLCFLEPSEDSPYALAWNQYTLTLHRDPAQLPPPEYLNQPKYRNPRDYRECLLAIEQLVSSIGDEGVFPVVRKMHATQDGAPEPIIPANVIMLHHMIAAVHMVLNDINSLDIENQEALKAARQSVLLFRGMPPIPFTEVDAFVVLVWSMIAKVLLKEVHRLSMLGEADAALAVAQDADTVIAEMHRIGQTMHLARTQAKAVEHLKRAAFAAGGEGENYSLSNMPQLESFMFPQRM